MRTLLKVLEMITPYGAWRQCRQGEVPPWQVALLYTGLVSAVLAFVLTGVLPHRANAAVQFVFVNVVMFSLLCGVFDDLVAGQAREKNAWFKFAMAPYMIVSQFMALGWLDLLTGSAKPGALTILGLPQPVPHDALPWYLLLSGGLLAGYLVRWWAIARGLSWRSLSARGRED